MLAGTAAALLPARFAARVPPVAALAASVPAGPPPRRVSRLGVLAVVLGCAVAGAGALPRVVDASSSLGVGLTLAGLAIPLGGFVACSTALVVAVEPLAARLPLAGRVATRQAARNRARTGPAVAAITMALAIPVLVSSVLLTTRADDRAHWRPALAGDQLRIQPIARDGREPPEAAVRAVLATLPGAVAAPLRLALLPTGPADPGEQAVVAGPGSPPASVPASLLALLFGVCAAVALAVVAAMVGLAQAEAGPERRVLLAVGASPSVLRGTAAAGAGLLGLLGGVLAVPAGLLPLAAVYAASPGTTPLVVPWAGVGATVALVPLLAAAGAAALTRTRRFTTDAHARHSPTWDPLPGG